MINQGNEAVGKRFRIMSFFFFFFFVIGGGGGGLQTLDQLEVK